MNGITYIIKGLGRILFALAFYFWWTVCFPLALAVFLLRFIGGDPDAERVGADGGALVLMPLAFCGGVLWCIVAGVLWYEGYLEAWYATILTWSRP